MLNRLSFEELDFGPEITPDDPLKLGDYDQCRFMGCDFSNTSLAGMYFSDCTFMHCNFSSCQLSNVVLNDVLFKGSKMLGLHFEDCHKVPFGFRFEDCVADFSSFTKCRMKGFSFIRCSLRETDFSGADLQEVLFDGCDLEKAVFEQSNLEKSDFRTSYHFSIDPSQNRMRKARFAPDRLEGLLNKFGLDIN
jgi:fluoroquinolone resistance protein